MEEINCSYRKLFQCNHWFQAMEQIEHCTLTQKSYVYFIDYMDSKYFCWTVNPSLQLKTFHLIPSCFIIAVHSDLLEDKRVGLHMNILKESSITFAISGDISCFIVHLQSYVLPTFFNTTKSCTDFSEPLVLIVSGCLIAFRIESSVCLLYDRICLFCVCLFCIVVYLQFYLNLIRLSWSF